MSLNDAIPQPSPFYVATSASVLACSTPAFQSFGHVRGTRPADDAPASQTCQPSVHWRSDLSAVGFMDSLPSLAAFVDRSHGRAPPIGVVVRSCVTFRNLFKIAQ